VKHKPAPALDPRHPALSEDRPHFVDNRDGNTLDVALVRHLAALRAGQTFPWGLSIASAFFDVPGFRLVADALKHAGTVRLLLGADPLPEAARPVPEPGAPPEPRRARQRLAEALRQLDDGLRRARDLLPFDPEADAAVRRLLALLEEGKLEVRRCEDRFLPAKAFLFNVEGGGVLAGSSNFSLAGLREPTGLTLGHYADPVVGRVEAWFEELWATAVPYDLAGLYARLTAEYPPYLIYLAVLRELYGDELGEEERDPEGIPVTTFQKHGVWRARRILKEFGGVLIADGVGLGKTFLAGEIIRQFRQERKRVLLVCPAALRDSTWAKFLNRFQLYVTCVSYEQLAADRRLGGDADHLENDLDDFALVVIDEGHNYRNPDAPKRAGVLRLLLQGPRRELVLLSATPVNNSLWDLYHLLRYFLKQDARLADYGVLSLHDRFDEAMREDPFSLNPDLLYPVIDATTVKRTRHFVKRFYPNDLITLPDGRQVPIAFPKPVPSTINYQLDAVLPGFFDRLEQALMPEDGHPELTLARYQPDTYLAGGTPPDQDLPVIGLLRSGLLKRFESSSHAFARTTARMVREHDLFLDGLDQKVIIKKEVLRELSAANDEDEIEELIAEAGNTVPARGYNVARLRAAVRADRDLLHDLHTRAATVKPDSDPKLAALVEELLRIAREADKEGIDAADRRRKRKVLVFSSYEDTIDYIEGHLRDVIDADKRLAAYRGRMASVAGRASRHGVTRDDAVKGFAPETASGLLTKTNEESDRFDLLLSTDVLAEGMNLQECRNIINYDLPWNPMRLVQRHGRIDRIGSPHPRVFLRTFFPDDRLNDLLDLEWRVRRKLAQAAASVGVDAAPIVEGPEREQSFAETREEIERLARSDPELYERGGTAGAAQSGEEYRQELRRALEKEPWKTALAELPWKAGSGMAKGSRRGHFFCARVGSRVYLRFVPADGGPLVGEMGTCLRLIECSPETERVVPDDLQRTAFTAWQRARKNIFEAWQRETDPANLQPRVPKLNREIAQFLRKHPPKGVEQTRLTRCLEAIEAPCSRREENAMRDVFQREYTGQNAKGQALVEAVEQLGLLPFHAPDPKPPIRPEDVHLVCWLAIESKVNAPGT
jgi:superfamily II DNA/RNA helicase